jgi:hypothetical protein
MGTQFYYIDGNGQTLGPADEAGFAAFTTSHLQQMKSS